MLEKPLMKVLLHIPYVDDRLLAKVKENLLQAFGGNVREVIIGGSSESGCREIPLSYRVPCHCRIWHDRMRSFADIRSRDRGETAHGGRMMDRMECQD